MTKTIGKTYVNTVYGFIFGFKTTALLTKHRNTQHQSRTLKQFFFIALTVKRIHCQHFISKYFCHDSHNHRFN